MAYWTDVASIEDGDPVAAETFSKPIGDLIARTDWLKDRIDAVVDPSSVVDKNAVFAEGAQVWNGCVVRVDDSGRYAPALASMDLWDESNASLAAHAVGVVVSDTTRVVCLFGKVDMSGMDMAVMLEDGEKAETGEYYLSSVQPGRLTRNPTGPRVLVGFIRVNRQMAGMANCADTMYVNPQYMGLSAHSHRVYRLSSKPARLVANAGAATSYLSVSGEFASSDDHNIVVTVMSSSGGSWPATVAAKVDGNDVAVSGSLMFFGDSVDVGDFGLKVGLVGSGSNEGFPLGSSGNTSASWSFRKGSCMGWLPASSAVSARLGSCRIAVRGVLSDSTVDTITVSNDGSSVSVTRGSDESVESLLDNGPATVDSAYSVLALKNGLEIVFLDVPSGSESTDVTFNSPVPGATYRYNIGFQKDLDSAFPPVPAKAGSLTVNGVELEEYSKFGEMALYGIGPDSLYWRMSDPPWSGDVGASDEMRLEFRFVSGFQCDTGPVTSLRPAVNSPITVRRCSTGEDASVGDLELDLDLTLGVRDNNESGFKAVKGFRGGKMTLGPVVEKIIAGPGISLGMSAGSPDGQGTVTIRADGTSYSGEFETVALENAKLESIGMFPYIRLLKWTTGSRSNVDSGFVAKFHVPATLEPGVYRVRFYATVFGEEPFGEGGYRKFAGVSMDWNVLPDFTAFHDNGIVRNNLRSSVLKAKEETVLNIPFGIESFDGSARSYRYDAYDPMLVHNDRTIEDVPGSSCLVLDHSFPDENDMDDTSCFGGGVVGLRPGDTVAIRFSRCANTVGSPYDGSIGFLNMRWTIEKVAEMGADAAQAATKYVRSTIDRLRRAAGNVNGTPDTAYAVVDVLQSIIDALK